MPSPKALVSALALYALGHTTQAFMFSEVEYFPASHVWHAVPEDAPTCVENCPAGHGTQEPTPEDTLYFPASHRVQTLVDAAILYSPAAQSTQLVTPFTTM